MNRKTEEFIKTLEGQGIEVGWASAECMIYRLDHGNDCRGCRYFDGCCKLAEMMESYAEKHSR